MGTRPGSEANPLQPPQNAEVDGRSVIVPITVGRVTAENRWHFRAIVGTSFFIGHRLAITAAHVLQGAANGEEFTVSWPDAPTGLMRSYQFDWVVRLPKSDIAVISLKDIDNPYLPVNLQELRLGADIETTGLAENLHT